MPRTAARLAELCTLVPSDAFATTGIAFDYTGTPLVQMNNRAGIGYIWYGLYARLC